MNKQEQINLIETLTISVLHTLAEDIRAGKVPEEWDGLELRQLVADRFANEGGFLSGKRKREYNNTVTVRNL